MRRWHEERNLMLNRYSFERREHEESTLFTAAWTPEDRFALCHCSEKGIGQWRKWRPLSCRCGKNGMCHWEKWLDKKKRSTMRRKAIEFELNAEN